MRKIKLNVIMLITVILICTLLVITINITNTDIKKGSLSSEYGTQEMQKSEDDGNYYGFLIFCNSNIQVRNNKANILAQNSENNDSPCIIKLYDDSDNLLYESDILNPGYYIEEVELNADLENGTYDGRVVFDVLDNSGSIKSSMTVNVNLTVN